MQAFDGADSEEKAKIVSTYRYWVAHDNPEAPAYLPLFSRIVGYQPGANNPLKKIEDILGRLYDTFPPSSEEPAFQPGYESMKAYCDSQRMSSTEESFDPATAWSQAAFIESQKLAMALYLVDLDKANGQDAVLAKAEIQEVMRQIYDPRRENTNGIGDLDCFDGDPLRGEYFPEESPAQLARKIREKLKSTGDKQSLLVTETDPERGYYVFFEDQGPNLPIRVKLPILLVPLGDDVDLNKIKSREAAIESLINNEWMPPEWHESFEFDVVFTDDPLVAQKQAVRGLPFQAINVNNLPVSDIRSHSNTITTEDSIATLAHELGHHLGWDDKYDEWGTVREKVLDQAWFFWAHGDSMRDEETAVTIAPPDMAWLCQPSRLKKLTEKDWAGHDRQAGLVDRLNSRVAEAALLRDDQKTLDAIYPPASGEKSGVNWHYYRARLLEKTDPVQAAALYDSLVEKFKRDGNRSSYGDTYTGPADYYWYRHAGQFYQAHGQIEKAKDLYQSILSSQWLYDPMANYFMSQLDSSFKSVALERLERLVHDEPKSFFGQYYLGRLYLDAGQPEKALACFEKTFKCFESDIWEYSVKEPGPERYHFMGQALQSLSQEAGMDRYARMIGCQRQALDIYCKGLCVIPCSELLLKDLQEFLPQMSLHEGWTDDALEAGALMLMKAGCSKGALIILDHIAQEQKPRGDFAPISDESISGDLLVLEALADWNTYGVYFSSSDIDLKFKKPETQLRYYRACFKTNPSLRTATPLARCLLEQGLRSGDEGLILESAQIYKQWQEDQYHYSYWEDLELSPGDFDVETLFALIPLLESEGVLSMNVFSSLARQAEMEGRYDLMETIWDQYRKAHLVLSPYSHVDDSEKIKIFGILFDNLDFEGQQEILAEYRRQPFSLEHYGSSAGLAKYLEEQGQQNGK